MTRAAPTSAVPPSGSPEAVMRGCTCPVIDNHHGDGVPLPSGRAWYRSADCPLHGWREVKE